MPSLKIRDSNGNFVRVPTLKGDAFTYDDFTPEQLQLLSVDKFYTHNQIASSSTWTINHNLNKYPSVTVVDSAGTVLIGDIQYINENTLIVSFSSDFSGKAYLN